MFVNAFACNVIFIQQPRNTQLVSLHIRGLIDYAD